ncbi:MAG: hypothetical protein ACK4OM_04410 [Alphaproteobacteria bacterium]
MTITSFNNKLHIYNETVESLKWHRDQIGKQALFGKFFIAPAVGAVTYFPLGGTVIEGYNALNDVSRIFKAESSSNVFFEATKFLFHTSLFSLSTYCLINLNPQLSLITPALATLEYAFTTENTAQTQMNAYNNAIEHIIVNGDTNSFTIEY